jgi:hypothetical protein
MALANAGFETAGAAPGLADQWTIGTTATAREYATMGAALLDLVVVQQVVSVPLYYFRVVLSAAAGEVPGHVAAITGSAEGAVCATIPVMGNPSLNRIAGISNTEPQSLCVIWDATTGLPLYSDGRRIFGLLQAEAGTVDGDAFDDATHQAQITFVRDNLAGGVEYVPDTDIGGHDIFYAYSTRTAAFERSREAFEEGWRGTDSFSLVLGLAAPAQFNITLYEGFSQGWGQDVFLDDFAGSELASFDANSYLDSASDPFVLALGHQLSVTTNLGGPALTNAVTGTRAQLIAANMMSGSFGAAGEDFAVHVNGRHVLTVTVDNGDIDVQDVADAINAEAALQGVSAEVWAFAGGVPAKLYVRSEWYGYESQIMLTAITVGTLTKIGLGTSQIAVPVLGTGNVSLTGAATAEDVAALVNGSATVAAIGAGATDLGGVARLFAPVSGTVRVNTTPMGTATGFPLDTTVGPATLAVEALEDLEEGWLGNEVFETEFGGGDLDAAIFDGEVVENFEDDWANNSFIWAFLAGHLDAALFDAEAVEDFEEVAIPEVCTPDPLTNVLTIVGHSLLAGDKVRLLNEGGLLPSGLNLRSDYYVTLGVGADAFQLARTPGGSIVDFTDTGTGTHSVQRDPAVWWTYLMSTI